MQYEKAKEFLLKTLDNGLPPCYTYHNTQHAQMVLHAAEHLAASHNFSDEELTLLKTAALFHDAGFLQQYMGHEEFSCKFAQTHLPQFDYTPSQIETICETIMATKLPQQPTNKLGEILADADLFYLGSEDYKTIAKKLFLEYKKFDLVKNEVDWNLKQIDFLTAHRYFTNQATEETNMQKQKNLAQIKTNISAQAANTKKTNELELVQDALFIIFGVLFAGFALKCFLVPNNFFDGGVTGISLLLHELYDFNLAVVIIVLNIPFILVSFFSVNKRFAYRTVISVVLLGVCLQLMPTFSVTQDKLLISIFGGIFLGAGIGLIMRAGAALDGIEVLVLHTLKRTSFTITEIILGINIIIFSIAALKFGIETALYSILTYFAATRSIDYVVEGLQAYTGVTIISGKSEIIKYQLVNNLGRGITIYKGERGFLPGQYEVSQDCDIIFTVITRLELRKLKNLVYEVDPKAFVFASAIKETSGGITNRRHLH